MTSLYEQRLESLVADFDLFEDWEDRYRYIIDLGKGLAPMDEADKTPQTLVRGCASQVWLVRDRSKPGHLRFRGDSDAFIVKGLIAILSQLLNDLPYEDLARLEAPALFTSLGLSEALSSQRTNGLMSMIATLKSWQAEA